MYALEELGCRQRRSCALMSMYEHSPGISIDEKWQKNLGQKNERPDCRPATRHSFFCPPFFASDSPIAQPSDT
jgi:hypothetical protein